MKVGFIAGLFHCISWVYLRSFKANMLLLLLLIGKPFSWWMRYDVMIVGTNCHPLEDCFVIFYSLSGVKKEMHFGNLQLKSEICAIWLVVWDILNTICSFVCTVYPHDTMKNCTGSLVNPQLVSFGSAKLFFILIARGEVTQSLSAYLLLCCVFWDIFFFNSCTPPYFFLAV